VDASGSGWLSFSSSAVEEKNGNARRWIAPAVVVLVLLFVYHATLAPTVTYWDAGEFLSAIHSLGIPHPPGTALFVLIANVWTKIFSPWLGFAYSVNVFSAVCTAAACGIAAWLMQRWTGNSAAAIAGGLTAGLMSSVWLNATETEVYSPAVLVSLVLFLVADQARITRERRWLILLVYLIGFGWALQLSALVGAPAAVFLALWRNSHDDERPLFSRASSGVLAAERTDFWMSVGTGIVVMLIGASAVVFMLVRARHDPAINQGNPATLHLLSDVLTRRQYLPAPLLPRQAPFYLQLGNMFEYADWQVALSLGSDPPPTIARTSVTIAFAILGLIGFLWHKRTHVPSWEAVTLLFITGTIGIVVYLNMKASPSYGVGFLPAAAKHEARERDYFFALGFMCWGLWAGAGAVRLFRRLGWPGKAIAFWIAFLPAVLNYNAVDRSRWPVAYAARLSAQRNLIPAPRNAVFFAAGDNDTYPVWFMQEVEGLRRDITPVTLPLLGATWYREELARRHQLLGPEFVETWRGLGLTYAELCKRSHALGRPVVVPRMVGAPAVPPECNGS
jgi:hypothetical protein